MKTIISQSIEPNSMELQNILENYKKSVLLEAQKYNFSPYLLEEIKWKLDIMSEESQYDLENMLYYPNAFLTLYQIILDIDDITSGNEKTADGNRLLKEIKMWFIKIGTYTELTKEQLANVYSTGKKYDFKMNGFYYIFKSHPPGFM